MWGGVKGGRSGLWIKERWVRGAWSLGFGKGDWVDMRSPLCVFFGVVLLGDVRSVHALFLVFIVYDNPLLDATFVSWLCCGFSY